MTKRIILLLLLVVCVLSIIPQLVSAQGGFQSWRSINMTGVDNSYLIIGMEGVNSSHPVIEQVIVLPILTGVRIYPISCDFGLLRPGDVKYTGLAFEILNATNLTQNVTIGVQGDWAGSTNWTHSDDCIPGVDTAAMVVIVQGSSSLTAITVRKSEPYNYMVTGLAPDQTLAFGLQLYAPTSFTEYSTKRNAIFITTEGS